MGWGSISPGPQPVALLCQLQGRESIMGDTNPSDATGCYAVRHCYLSLDKPKIRNNIKMSPKMKFKVSSKSKTSDNFNGRSNMLLAFMKFLCTSLSKRGNNKINIKLNRIG